MVAVVNPAVVTSEVVLCAALPADTGCVMFGVGFGAGAGSILGIHKRLNADCADVLRLTLAAVVDGALRAGSAVVVAASRADTVVAAELKCFRAGAVSFHIGHEGGLTSGAHIIFLAESTPGDIAGVTHPFI